MNKKLLLISIPMAIVPYLVLFALAAIFFSTSQPFFHWIMESVFCSNALYLIAALLIYYVLTVVLSVVCFIVSIYKQWDAVSLAKTAMIVKLVQVPAYVCIFALGVALALGILTLPVSIGLFLIDCLSVFVTGLLVLSSAITAMRKNIFTPKEVFWVIPLQFVFCADVISSIIFYVRLKRFNGQEH